MKKISKYISLLVLIMASVGCGNDTEPSCHFENVYDCGVHTIYYVRTNTTAYEAKYIYFVKSGAGGHSFRYHSNKEYEIGKELVIE